jgi:PAS domain S-box-containing protein
MDIASAHNATPFLIAALIISAGIVFYLALQAVVVGALGRRKSIYFVFAVTCLCAVVYQLSTAAYYRAGSLAAALSALHWQTTSVLVFHTAFFGFTALYTGQRRIKPWIIGVGAGCFLFLILDWSLPYGLRFTSLAANGFMVLPWGERLAYFKGTPSMLNGLVRASHLAVFIWAAARSVIQCRRGERRAALFLGTYLVIQFATGIEGGLVDIGVLDSVYTNGFGFLALAVLMSIGMGIEIRKWTVAIESTTEELRSAVDMLKQSEERLQRAIEAGRVGTWEWDITTNRVDWSKGAEQIFGTRPGSIVGSYEAYRALVHPDDLPLLDQSVKQAMKKEGPLMVEYRMSRPDGTTRWLLGRGYSEAGPDGRIVRIRGTVLDITERKRAEEAIQERLQFERLISDLSANFVKAASQDLEAKIEQGLELIARFLGVERASIGETSENKQETYIRYSYVAPGIRPLPPTLLSTLFPWYTRTLNSGKVVVLSQIPDDFPGGAEVEREFAQKEGFKSVLIVPLEIGGTVIGGMGFTAFHTERSWPEDLIQRLRLVGEVFSSALHRKRAMEALRESEERFRRLSEGPLEGIAVSDQGRILDVNEQMAKMLGYTHDELIGMHVSDLVAPESRELVLGKIEAGDEKPYEHMTVRKDGSVFPVEVNGKTIPYKGRMVRVTVIRDITERKRADDALRSALAEVEKLKDRLQAENIYLQDEIKLAHNFEEFITRSQNVKMVLRKVEQVAPTNATVLILGESGTGKELLARAVHHLGHRSDRPLVKVNCAALPENLIESELFGHEKGAFTGAMARKSGRFELADGGTIFLDEVGELPLGLQVKLLRVLQEGEFERVGSSHTLKVDVRVIAATNRNLDEAIQQGSFREDLYYRLNVFPVFLPPLRERKEDIPDLARHFIKKYCAIIGKRIEKIPQTVLDSLMAYHWPGNVRELENRIERAVILTNGPVLEMDEPLELHSPQPASEPSPATLRESEIALIQKALDQSHWIIEGKRGAAHRLGIAPSTLRDRMEKYGLHRPREQS